MRWTQPRMEFRAVLGPDNVARVLYVREDSPSCGTIHASDLSSDCQSVADEHNRERQEREKLEAAGQKGLFDDAP